MLKKACPESFRRVRLPAEAGSAKAGPVLSQVEGKAAALLTRGAYSQYVSTAKGRPAYAKPLRQAWNADGLPAVAFAKAGGFFQHFLKSWEKGEQRGPHTNARVEER